MSTQSQIETRLLGTPVSDGVVCAPVHLLGSVSGAQVPVYLIAAERVDAEKGRLKRALDTASAQLEALTAQVTERLGPSQANIFVAQRLMVEDPMGQQEMFGHIEHRLLNAEAAIARSLDAYETVLSEVDDVYLKERASDIGEIRRRLLDILQAERGEAPDHPAGAPESDVPQIIVARELTPAQTVSLDPALTAGFITERGGPASHAAILARALGVPAVTGVARVESYLGEGETVLLDGSAGAVFVRPSERTLARHAGVRRAKPVHIQAVPPVKGFTVMANISLAGETALALSARAEGIGLYRTEIELLAAGRMLSEDEQFERYASVLSAMAGQPVYFRLFDLGSDKEATFLELAPEENPCLGFRGARLLEGRPDILAAQARALYRAAALGTVRVVYPMIIDAAQFMRLRALFEESVADLPEQRIQHGAMFEVPAAGLDAHGILAASDFGSIGSNDLVQYLFAMDRNNAMVARDYRPDHAALWSLLEQLGEAARAAGKPLSLCGEMGSQAELLPRLMDTGIRAVSVSARLVGLTRAAAQRHLDGGA